MCAFFYKYLPAYIFNIQNTVDVGQITREMSIFTNKRNGKYSYKKNSCIKDERKYTIS